MLKRLAGEGGIETPAAQDLIGIDRRRKGRKLSNRDHLSRIDPDAGIARMKARMKDGTTHLACPGGHAVALDSGAVVAAALHLADQGDARTLGYQDP